jgi:hypothetical protein
VPENIQKAAADFLLALKLEQPVDDYLARLFALAPHLLLEELRSDQFGGTDPQDRGKTGWAVSWGSCVCGMFFVWGRTVHPRPLATPASGGQVFALIWR